MNPKLSKWLLFCLIALALYGVSLYGEFVFDDRGIIDHYAVLQNPFELKQIFSLPYWTEEAGLYRPVTLLSYGINFLFLSTSPVGFHFVNILLYGFIAYFLYKLLKVLHADETHAFLAAIIFIFFPIHSEVVANITGRSELLALFFSLLFLIEILKEKINVWKIGLFLFLSIAAKETGIAAIPIALVIIFIKENNIYENTRSIIRKYLYPGLAGLVAVVSYFSLRLLILGQEYFIGIETSIVENPLIKTSWIERVPTAFSILTMYVKKTFIPQNLCSDYSFNQIPTISNFFHIGPIMGIIIFIAAIISIIYFIKRDPRVSLGSAFFLFAYLPISNLFFPIGTIAGERLMFYPSVGLAIISSVICLKIYNYLLSKKELYAKIGLGIFITLMFIYAFISIQRSIDWLSEKRLFLSASKCAPNSILSLSNLGTVYYFDGKYGEAEKILLDSMNIYDGYSKGLNNLGLVYWKIGKLDKAKDYYRQSLLARFPYPGAIENMSLLYLSQNDTKNARRWLNVFYPNKKQEIDSYLKQYAK